MLFIRGIHSRTFRCTLEQEEEQDADHIVLGKHGAGKALLLGSVTEQLLAHTRGEMQVA
ncbi:MAG: universal stress protein [Rhodocyclaceae bacterium]